MYIYIYILFISLSLYIYIYVLCYWLIIIMLVIMIDNNIIHIISEPLREGGDEDARQLEAQAAEVHEELRLVHDLGGGSLYYSTS